VRAISPDGTTIAGVGCGPDIRDEFGHCAAWIWVATIPEPSSATLVLLGGATLVSWGRQRRSYSVGHTNFGDVKRTSNIKDLMIMTVKQLNVILVAGLALSQMANVGSAAEFRILDGLDGFPVGGMHGPRLGVSANGTRVFGSGIGISGEPGFRTAYWTPGGGTLDIGQLPGNLGTFAEVASDDLGVLFGSNFAECCGDETLFRWTKEDGISDLGSLWYRDEGAATLVLDATPDGSTFVGANTLLGSDEIAFRWTEEAGIEQIADGVAYAVSDDGEVVVGDASGGGVFRWTAGAGLETILARGRALDVSADGSVVVGFANNESYDDQAFRWSVEGGLQLLDLPLGRDQSYAHAVSADGKVVVGTMSDATSNYSMGNEVFRWTAESGVEVLTPNQSVVFDAVLAPLVSRDGDVIVATGYSDEVRRSFIWREGRGTEFLSDVLGDEFGLGEQMDDWVLVDVRAIAPDGSAFAGRAVPRDGVGLAVWVATIPEPGAATLMLTGCLALGFRRTPTRRDVSRVKTRGGVHHVKM